MLEATKKELMFNEIKKDISTYQLFEKIDKGELITDDERILIKSENKLHYLTYIPYDFENIKLHGSTRKVLAREFIKENTFQDLKESYKKEVERILYHLELEEKNKYKLEDLYNSIAYLEKYNNNNRYLKEKDEGRVKFAHGFEAFMIEFSFSINEYSSENIRIKMDSEYNNFEFSKNYIKENKTKEQIIELLKELAIKYESIYQEKENKKALEKTEAIKLYNKEMKLREFYKLEKGKTVLFKNKKTFIAFRNGIRYAVGEGKQGKYYRCDYYQLLALINKKNIVDYIILEDNTKTYNMSNKELQELNYCKLC